MLEVHDLWKSYEGKPLLRGISFSIQQNETVCLLGASGSGKSTLLRIIAGLETPERGRILWEGKDLREVPVHKRGFGMVFQDYALFPHLNAAENVGFGLKMMNLPKEQIDLRVAELFEQVKLQGFEKRDITQLSGGEQQRISLARAMAPGPRLLMFDEPLGALDRNLREILMEQLRSILHSSEVPAIYVTHDQEEAFAIADRILMLHDGEIARSGKPDEIWKDPGSAWAALFLDIGNVVEGRLRLENGKALVDTQAGIFEIVSDPKNIQGDKVQLLIRPEGSRRTTRGNIKGRVADILFRQDRYKVTLTNGLFFFLSEAPEIGEEIELAISPEAIQCLR